jgi:hypothetical protein
LVISKDSLRKQHPDYGFVTLELAHIVDAHEGGKRTGGNLVPMTRPQHLLDHMAKADTAPNQYERRRQLGAAISILNRMDKTERQEISPLLPELRIGQHNKNR